MRQTRRPLNPDDWPSRIPPPDAIRLARLSDDAALQLVIDLCHGHPGIQRAILGEEPARVTVEGPLCLRVVRGQRGETAPAIRVRLVPPRSSEATYAVLLTPGPDGRIVAQVRTTRPRAECVETNPRQTRVGVSTA